MVELPAPQPRVLVIGYGNTLRRDDGVGWLIAQEVESWRRPDVQSLGVAQLTPELAAPMATAQAVLFVDARESAAHSGVRVERVRPLNETVPSMVHASSPRFLLGLCRAVFGRCPPSWLVSVPAADFSIGEGLSVVADLGMKNAVGIIREILTDLQRVDATDR
jgi:hydrogenase maturation protease